MLTSRQYKKRCCSLLPIIAISVAAVSAAQADEVLQTPRPERLDFEVEERLQPGLILQLNGGEDEETSDARTSRLAALDVPQGQPASVFLEPGPFTATFRGLLMLELPGEYRFSLAGQGAATLWLNGTKILAGDGKLAGVPARTASVHAPFNQMRVEYRPPAQGEATLRLYWKPTGPRAEAEASQVREPLPPAQLWHDPDDPALAQPSRLRLGRQLFAKRGCAQCHALPGDLALDQLRMPEMALGNPSLASVGERLRSEWIFHWLLGPRALRKRATMPALWANSQAPEARAEAADVVAYLASLAGEPQSTATATSLPPLDPDAPLVREGEIYFEDLGCIACHRLTALDVEDYYERTSLYYAAAKFRPGQLARFLKQPHAHYAASPMPDFRLADDEAAALAAYLDAYSEGSLPEVPELAKTDPARGRETFLAKRCHACHAVEVDAAEPGLPSALPFSVGAPQARRGCLAEEPLASAAVAPPDHGLSSDEREALAAFLIGAADSLTRFVPAEASNRLVTELRCIACHARDDQYSYLSEVILEEGVQGRPPQAIPHLTWAGEKLQRDWLGQLLRGELTYRARPWLKARMPGLEAHAAALAHGLPAEHGFSGERRSRPAADAALAQIGQTLTQQNVGFYCVECHATGEKPPVSAFDHRGIDFPYVTERLQYDYYLRWMHDPKRIAPASKMPQFSKQPKASILDGDAGRQFEALWHYLESLQK